MALPQSGTEGEAVGQRCREWKKREEEIKEGMVKDAEGVNIWLKKNIGKSLRMIEKSQNWSIMSCRIYDDHFITTQQVTYF